MSPRQKGLVKTKTIKQRKVEVYLPSLEERERWTQEAEQRGLSLSQMVTEIVGVALSPDEQGRAAQTKDLQAEVSTLRSDLATAQRRISELEATKERLMRDLEENKAEAFLESAPIKKLDKRINRILSESRNLDGSHRPVTEWDLRRGVGIGARDELRLRALNKQLEILEIHNIVRRTNKGWVWND